MERFLKFLNKCSDLSLQVCLMRSRLIVVICLTGLWLSGGWATALTPQEPSVIEELLQLDTQAALLAARKNVVGTLAQPGPVTNVSNENTLLAIYGVGQSLTAEVLLDSELHVFKNRRAKPFAGRFFQYTLERISPPCIHLKKNGTPEVLCLGQVKP